MASPADEVDHDLAGDRWTYSMATMSHSGPATGAAAGRIVIVDETHGLAGVQCVDGAEMAA
jgi:hypothetical protein